MTCIGWFVALTSHDMGYTIVNLEAMISSYCYQSPMLENVLFPPTLRKSAENTGGMRWQSISSMLCSDVHFDSILRFFANLLILFLLASTTDVMKNIYNMWNPLLMLCIMCWPTGNLGSDTELIAMPNLSQVLMT